VFIRRYDHQTEEGAEHQARVGRLFSEVCDCAFGLVLLLLEQIKPIEQLVPVS
jgi:hypothetical protein